MNKEVICPYCKGKAKLVTGDIIYPNQPTLFKKNFWLCKPCWSYVGVHKNSKSFIPLGRLANKELRLWKCRAHAAFDVLWNRLDTKGQSLTKRRKAAYLLLATKLNLTKRDCHIGWFDITKCKEVIKVCKDI